MGTGVQEDTAISQGGGGRGGEWCAGGKGGAGRNRKRERGTKQKGAEGIDAMVICSLCSSIQVVCRSLPIHSSYIQD